MNKYVSCVIEELPENEHNEGYYRSYSRYYAVLCFASFNESTLIFHSVINHSKINKFSQWATKLLKCFGKEEWSIDEWEYVIHFHNKKGFPFFIQ